MSQTQPRIRKPMSDNKITIEYSHFMSLNKSILDLGYQVRDLTSENKGMKEEIQRLERLVNYWRIEAETDHGRWMRTLEDLDNLRRTMK